MATTTHHTDLERSSDSGNSGNNGKTYHEKGYNEGDTQSEIEHQQELERIHTFERVGTHAAYYEKGGLRTEGDGLDHKPHKVRRVLLLCVESHAH